MSRVETTTNFRDNDGVDLGKKLITKDYLISVYPGIGDKIGIPPELWTWGAVSGGRLGNGVTTGNISTPVTTFAGGSSWKQVSSGDFHTAAVKTDGTLWTWGFGNNGRLGNAVTTGNISTPVTTFAGGSSWKQVSSGNAHTAAIKTDGTLWTWGVGGNGRLGNAVTTGNISTPVTTFAGGTNWKQVSSGYVHTAAIKTDGTLWTWGRCDNGELGEFTQYVEKTVIGSISDFDNTIFTSNTNGVTTGDGIISSNPDLSLNGASVTSVVTNTSITLDLFTEFVSGTDVQFIFAKLPPNTTSTPITTFAGGTNWKQVSSGNAHTAATKTDGTLWTWGGGTYGRLGINSSVNRYTPVTTFAGGTNWKQVSSGRDHTAAIQSSDFI